MLISQGVTFRNFGYQFSNRQFFPQEICGSPHYLAPELIGALAFPFRRSKQFVFAFQSEVSLGLVKRKKNWGGYEGNDYSHEFLLVEVGGIFPN